MALKPCPHCGNHISDKATKCPKCGAELSEDSFSESVVPKESEEEEQQSYIPEDFYQEPQPRYKRWGMIVIPLIAIVTIGGCVLYFNNEKKNNEALMIAEQARQDSILAVQKEAERLEQLRQDSIKLEDAYRLSAEVWFSEGETMMNENWKTKILELGFEEGQTVKTSNVEGEYEYELYETRYIPYSRTINGRKIEIRENQERFIRNNLGEYIYDKPWRRASFSGISSFNIFFEVKSDYEEFKNSLVLKGMKYNENERLYGFWDKSDPSPGYRHEGETLINFKENVSYEVEMKERIHNGD